MFKAKLPDDFFLRFPSLKKSEQSIYDAAGVLIDCYAKGGKLVICGNGGSSSDADHLAGELMKSFEKPRPLDESLKDRFKEMSAGRGKYLAEKLESALPVISLSSNAAVTTAISNDIDPALVFAQQVVGYGNEGDVFLGISTSGNSQNVIDALITAKALNLTTIGLTGKSGGRMRKYCDVIISVPETGTARIQDLHRPVLHGLCSIIELYFYGTGS